MMPINPVDGVSGVGGGLPPDSTKEFGKVGSAAEHQKLEKEEGPSDGSGIIDRTSPPSKEAEAWRKERHITLETTKSGLVVLRQVDPEGAMEVAAEELGKEQGIERARDKAQEDRIEEEQVREISTVTSVQGLAESQEVPAEKVPDPPDPPTKQPKRRFHL